MTYTISINDKLNDGDPAIQSHVVANGPISSEGKNRRLASLATTYARATNGATWVRPKGPTEVYITIRPTAAFTNEKKAEVVFDCSSEVEAQAAFANTGGLEEPILSFPLILGVRNGPFSFSAPIHAIDITTSVVGEAIVEAL